MEAGRRKLAIRGAILAVALPVLVAAGCGDDEGDTTQGTPLSQADFIAQADAICTEGNNAIEQAADQRFGTEEPSDEEIAAFAEDEIIPALEEQANGLDELGAPEGDVEQVDAIITELRSAIEELRADPSLVLAANSGPFAEANRLAAGYGLEVCGEG